MTYVGTASGRWSLFKKFCNHDKYEKKLPHVSWNVEFSYNGRFGDLKNYDWQEVKGDSGSQPGFPKAEDIILMRDSHWNGKIDLFIVLIQKLKTTYILTSMNPSPRGNRQINYVTPTP